MPFVALLLAAALVQQTPTPQPFPRPGASRPARPEAPPTAPPPAGQHARTGDDPEPTEESLGLPIYPAAQFLASYDAGRGQRYYLFGSTASFVELVAYYRTILRQRGNVVFEVPATHAFEVGRFREDRMAFPPGVTIKDYQSAVSQGFPNPKPGGEPARFPTVIQIVPSTEQ